MADKWKTPRRCKNCLEKKQTNYLWAQPWGENDMDQSEFKLNCEVCSYTEYTQWNGHDVGKESDDNNSPA